LIVLRGQIEIPISTLRDKKFIDDWFELKTDSSNVAVSGHLHLSLELLIPDDYVPPPAIFVGPPPPSRENFFEDEGKQYK
jgi:hypothetical protein